MRTNVVIDDALIDEALRLTRIRTKREVIDRALRTLVRLQRQREVLGLAGKINWEGDLDSMRLARFQDINVTPVNGHAG